MTPLMQWIRPQARALFRTVEAPRWLLVPLLCAVSGCGNIQVGALRVVPHDETCACGPRRTFVGCEVDIEIEVAPTEDSAGQVLNDADFVVEIGAESFAVRPKQKALRFPWLAKIDKDYPGIFQQSVNVRLDGQSRVISRMIEVVVPQSNPETPQLDCLWFEPSEAPEQSIGIVRVAVSPELAQGSTVVASLRDADLEPESGTLMAVQFEPEEGRDNAAAAELPGEPPLLEGLVCKYDVDAFVVPQADAIRWRETSLGPKPVSLETAAGYTFSGPCTPRQHCRISGDGSLDCVETQEEFLNGTGVWR